MHCELDFHLSLSVVVYIPLWCRLLRLRFSIYLLFIEMQPRMYMYQWISDPPPPSPGTHPIYFSANPKTFDEVT